MNHQNSQTIRLSHLDNVVIAAAELQPGRHMSNESLTCRQVVPRGHKLATVAVKSGEPIIKYGHVIGLATEEIKAGDHVHTHNMTMTSPNRTYAHSERDASQARTALEIQDHFNGIVRPNGRVGTRNYIGVVATSGCSSLPAGMIAESIPAGMLADFSRVDGIVPITHGSGCGLADHGDGIEYLQRALVGWARHPNFAGILVVGLGCEINQLDNLMTRITGHGDLAPAMVRHLNIQDAGGTQKTVDLGMKAIMEMLPTANSVQRTAVPASHLVLGLECGGSDAYSGITANPALGVASDLLVQQGGKVILGETTEIYGAEHLLIARACSKAVGQKLIDRIGWWEAYTSRNGVELNNNPSPGNKAGGLTTILEKSLGAVAKAGSTPLMEVYGFAEPVTSQGLVFMDTPGYDLVSVTGMVAGGANIVCFTTGCGSVFGGQPVPTLKLASNTPMYNRMAGDMDIDCGGIVTGETSLESVGQTIYDNILSTASGEKTQSEKLHFRTSEFVPWTLGAIL